MKSTKKVISIILTVLMLMSCVSATFTVNASTGTLCDYYATNPSNKVGVQKTITIDGDASDWSDDMLIAQGAAWDVANHYKGGHENCVLDTYALYAAWDNSNLYIGWQMVNTTDTWAREGDGPLSDGGRVLDVPLILALSVDPTSTSMSNKNTSGGSIWGQKMGLEFEQHVDHLFYMSGKPGLGTPAMFTAVDSNGNTDYNSGCTTFASAGIEYKMAETNICSSIYGLNYSEDTSDVYDSSADWVDYKTFAGSAGTHDTSYDSFYEIKIPLTQLGIDASYLQSNGIGAMLVATRGESGLDCIPFDDTMLDNATGEYSSDSSTSAEKDDVDTITSSFARIGKASGDQPITQPTTVAPTTVVPTTVAPTTEPLSDTLTVNATSNLFSTKTTELSENAETVTVTYDLKSAMNIVNGQWTLTYDSSKLKLKSDSSTITPYISDGVINVQDGVIKGNFTNVSNLYDFTSEKAFVQATFDVIGKGTTEVNLDVQELSVGYLSNGVLNYKNAVVNSTKQDLSSTSGFTSSSISGEINVAADQVATTAPVTTAPVTTPATTAPVTTKPVDTDTLTVNATSNFFPAVSQTYDASEEQIIVTYKLKSSMDVINSEWVLTYDPNVLSFDKSGLRKLMPQVSSPVINESTTGIIKGNFSDLSLISYSTESDFVSITFDVIGTGVTEVDLFVNVLGVAYLNDDFQAVEAYVVDFGEIKDVTTKDGFENETYTVRTVLSTPTVEPTTVAPTTQPATQPTTVAPTTQPTTEPSGDTLKVTATSNVLTPVSKVYSADEGIVTVTYKLKSAMYIVNGQWQLTYDDTKLSYNASKNTGGITPNIPGAIINTTESGEILGDFSNLGLYDFTSEQTFVTVTFDVVGTGETTVNLNLEILGVAYLDDDMQPIIAYPIDNSQLTDITGYAGFEKHSLTGKILLSDPGTSDIVYGDVDGNGSINISDATLLQKYIVKLESLSADQLARADVDHNGTVNISDASVIQKYVAKLITSF